MSIHIRIIPTALSQNTFLGPESSRLASWMLPWVLETFSLKDPKSKYSSLSSYQAITSPSKCSVLVKTTQVHLVARNQRSLRVILKFIIHPTPYLIHNQEMLFLTSHKSLILVHFSPSVLPSHQPSIYHCVSFVVHKLASQPAFLPVFPHNLFLALLAEWTFWIDHSIDLPEHLNARHPSLRYLYYEL